MTRKDYVALANELGDVLGGILREGIEGTEDGFYACLFGIMRVLQSDNSLFRRDKFQAAVEYRAETGKVVRVGQTNFTR